MKFSTAFFALIPLVAALPPAIRSDGSNSTEVTRRHSHSNVLANSCIADLCQNSWQYVRTARRTTIFAKAHVQFYSFVCTDAGFTGNCGVFSGASGQCINFPSSFNDDITAVGPDDGQDCFFYMQVFPLKP
jgi:hypothetical protein